MSLRRVCADRDLWPHLDPDRSLDLALSSFPQKLEKGCDADLAVKKNLQIFDKSIPPGNRQTSRVGHFVH